MQFADESSLYATVTRAARSLFEGDSFSAEVCLQPGFINGASQAIWQANVEGRVPAARRLIARLSRSVTPVLAGALADYVTEPAMRSPTWLATAFGPLVTGPGSGMALQFIFAVLGYMGVVLFVFLLVPAVRHLEDRLSDYDAIR